VRELAPLLVVWFALVPQLARAASFTPLGDVPGAFNVATAHAVSDDGAVVVGTVASGPDVQAFRWSGGSMELLGSAGFLLSFGSDVSADGSVVVGGLDVSGPVTSAPVPYSPPFRWSGGVMTPLDVPDPDLSSGNAASAVSSDGSVVVGQLASGGEQAFRWEAGVTTGLGVLPGGYSSSATDVSANGEVVVGTAISGEFARVAFLWSDGVMSSLALPDDVSNSEAFAVSADGQFVVGRMTRGAAQYPYGEAFRWSEGEVLGLGYLADLGIESLSVATGVSGDGSVVIGSSYTGTPGSSSAAFVWTESAGMQPLLQVLLENGATGLEGWQLLDGNGISTDGRWIVGYGINPDGEGESFLANISVPEPSAAWLLGSALAVVACVRRRIAG